MEVLSQRICKLVEQKEWRPIKIGGAALMISHIFFADDLLLFAESYGVSLQIFVAFPVKR